MSRSSDQPGCQASPELARLVKKTGYKGWQRKMKVAGGEVSVKAELEKDTEAAK